MNRFKQFLAERKQVGKLYHYTSLKNFENIMKKNKLVKVNTAGVSFTRNKNFHKYGQHDTDIPVDVRITVDGDKLSDKYKIKPFDYYGTDLRYEPDKVDEMEEIIESDIQNIKKYILAIDSKYSIDDIKSKLEDGLDIKVGQLK